jgi:predicted enzyme related to lactoylglutathione lyase
MRRVTGIGGIFFKARDPKALAEWYREHLGLGIEAWGGAVFQWSEDNAGGHGTTVWNAFKDDTEYFGSPAARFMVNYRVEDLHGLLTALRNEGCAVDDKVDESEYGKFGWVTDPEGNRVELWQPPEGR